MPDFEAWRGDVYPLAAWDDTDPAHEMARIIAHKTTSITVTRVTAAGSSTLAAQNVRIETMQRGEQTVVIAGSQRSVDAIVFGYAGHPSIASTDLQAGDRFLVGGHRYEVLTVLVGLDNALQAHCEAQS